MKSVKLAILSLILAIPTFASAAAQEVYIHSGLYELRPIFKPQPFFEAQTGIIASNGSQAPTYGVRGGILFLRSEVSLGYWGASGMESAQLVSRGLDIHTISLEFYRRFALSKNTVGKLGGGVGFTIPNLDGGVSETADNDHSWAFGGGVDYALSPSVSLGAAVKGFFFTTDTHLTVYGSHMEEILSNGVPTGQSVEVLDVTHVNNRIDFNSLLAQISIRWK